MIIPRFDHEIQKASTYLLEKSMLLLKDKPGVEPSDIRMRIARELRYRSKFETPRVYR